MNSVTKNASEGMNSRLNDMNERVSGLEGGVMETIQSGRRKGEQEGKSR